MQESPSVFNVGGNASVEMGRALKNGIMIQYWSVDGFLQEYMNAFQDQGLEENPKVCQQSNC